MQKKSNLLKPITSNVPESNVKSKLGYDEGVYLQIWYRIFISKVYCPLLPPNLAPPRFIPPPRPPPPKRK